MQDEVNTKVVAIMIKGGKISAEVLKKALDKFVQEIEKAQKQMQQPKTYRGKQSIKHLMSQNAAISNIEVTDGNIKSFERTASKYGLDFALKKDVSVEPPSYLVFFKGRDVDVMTAAFKEFSAKTVKQKEQPSIRHKLDQEKAQSKAQHKEKVKAKTKDRCGAVNKPDVKKLILLNLPYVFAFYFADKIAAVFRLAPGAAFIDKLTNGFAVFGSAFANPLPSFHPVDLLIGLSAGVLLKLAVYVKGKNRKKFRQGEEYGSARWGKPEDIKPYMDPEFSNNVILTQTEFLTMNSRPKQPKYARNKNILVIGGSGSGKTRFFVKPNLMQMHSSYVVTDPKGYNEQG